MLITLQACGKLFLMCEKVLSIVLKYNTVLLNPEQFNTSLFVPKANIFAG